MVAQGREDARRLQPGVRREDVRDASRARLEPLATHRTLSDRREVSRILSVRGTLGFVRGTSQQHQITASSKFGPPGGQTLADLLRPQTHDLFAESRS